MYSLAFGANVLANCANRQRVTLSSNVSSLLVDERHVYWIEAGTLRRRDKG